MSFANDVIHKGLYLNKMNCFHYCKNYMKLSPDLQITLIEEDVFMNKVVTMK